MNKDNNNPSFYGIKYVNNKIFILSKVTKLAMIYYSLSGEQILKYYLPTLAQKENTIMRTVMSINSALTGYKLVMERLPAQSILIDGDEENRFLLLSKVEGTTLLERFPINTAAIKNILFKIKQWDDVGLFHDTLTPENILIDSQENVNFVDFDDVILSNDLIAYTSNFINLLHQTVHSIILNDKLKREEKFIFIEQLVNEYKSLDMSNNHKILNEVFSENIENVFTTFQFAGNFLKLLFEVGSGWLRESELKANSIAIANIIISKDFDLNTAVNYLSLFLLLDANADRHKRALLNPATLFSDSPTVFIYSSSAFLKEYHFMNKILDSLEKGRVFIFSDQCSCSDIIEEVKANGKNIEMILVNAGDTFAMVNPLIMFLNTPIITLSEVPSFNFNRSFESSLRFQVVATT
jgi:tRNA A-37 threonylcarbamoyl transferase component Bud32